MKKEMLTGLFIMLLMISCVAQRIATKGSYIRLIPNSVSSSANKANESEIEIYYEKKPEYQCVEIGIVEAIAYGEEAGLKEVFEELKKQTALAGGTAVYKIEIQRYNQTGDAIHATGIAVKEKSIDE